ncbi:hypothetical protein CCYA_CCYA01G0216 [Cyanidiococcus yangmingshanensis]|nr:hypothetical protein CCYA_CCYA01G0216 [Cyanidiococcus yangmingshanensis]
MTAIWEQVKALFTIQHGSYAERPDTPEGRAYEQGLMLERTRSLPPWPLFKLGAVYGLGPQPAPVRVYQDGALFFLSACLGVAALFRFADIIGQHGGGLTAEEIAKECNCRDANAVARVLRACENWGYFESYAPNGQDLKRVANEQRLWRNTALSAMLRENHPQSARSMIVHLYVDVFPASSVLFESMRDSSGSDLEPDQIGTSAEESYQPSPTAFERVHQGTFWEYLARHPDRWDNFHGAMRGVDSGTTPSILQDIDWGRFLRVVDIGGADGSLTFHLLRSYALKGVIFDMPPVVEHAKQFWNSTPERAAMVTNGRVQFAAGDFLQGTGLPPAQEGDVYIMRNIWHDWRVQECVRIGQSIREAIGRVRNVHLIILEASIDQCARGSPLERMRALVDQTMLTVFGSRERDRLEFEVLLQRCGFQLTEMRPLRAPMVAVFAQPSPTWRSPS